MASVMVTQFWMLAGSLLMLIGVVARSYPIATLGLLLMSAVLLARLWSHYSLRAVKYSRALSSDRMYAGESVELEVSLTNAKPLALAWLLVEDKLDTEGGLSKRMVVRNLDVDDSAKHWEIRHTVSVGWYERVRWRYELECPRRGYFHVGPARLRSGDPFGFYEQELFVPSTVGVLVYPRLVPLEQLGLSSRYPFEGQRSDPAALLDPLNVVGARPYAEGDTLRQVHWRASARGSELQSKVLRPTTELSLAIFLDLASNEHAWEGVNAEVAERAISTAATLAHRAHASRWTLALYVNGLQPGTHQRIRIGGARGDEALARVMEVLARVPLFPTMAFSELLRTERRRLPIGASVVAVTAVATSQVSDQIELYRRAGRNARLLDVRGRPEVIDVAVLRNLA